MAKHILLIDGNSIAHANHNATQLTVGKLQTQAIFGFLNTLRALLDATPGDVKPIVLWDGRAEFRFELYPDYKGNRKALDAKKQAHKDAFKAQTPFLEHALKLLGVAQMRCPTQEADDLAAHWTTRLAAGKQITLVSGDRDWIQLVNEDVEWFDPINDRRVTTDNFMAFTGYSTVEEYVQGKALQGDGSDNVPGIAGLGEKGAQLFIAEHRSVQSFFDKIDAGTYAPKARKSKTATSLHPEQVLASPEGREVFRRNLALMDLRAAPVPTGVITTLRQPDPEAFRVLCERLHFASIVRRWGEFMRAFGIPQTPAALAA